ncbi:MAG TPA: OsmC family peroxiredoxin [Solirubrobacterales bacterium]|jgi:osmotically inducible protein OsmC|nr:OsmC family peroxiredoxin [Solirubrobacterales bacterium]HWA54523.1 OsmC family peroxiredoxin [Solirubrobacterales bacterium]
MAIATRAAKTTWSADLASGHGVVQADSGGFDDLDVTWASRTEAPGGKTSPEELCAAAHSSCFAMALALKLGESKMTPQELQVKATVTLAEVDGLPTIVSSVLDVGGRVDGLDAAGFEAVVAEAAALCPVSRLFSGAEVTVDSHLLAE